MNITYNNLDLPSNLITFTDIPNILKVVDDGGGSKAHFDFYFSSSLASQTTSDGQWYITFLGETITNVMNPSEAVNKNFFVAQGAMSTTVSVARAFRNCPVIAAQFDVYPYENAQHVYAVRLIAKAVGQVWSGMQNYFSTNISSTYLQTYGTDGYADSTLSGAKIDVDVFSGDEYVTTLEKSYYGSECAFNLSPVLTTLAEYGRVKPYTLKVSSLINGQYNLLGNVDENYISIGYMVNQGSKYLFNNYFNIAANVSRGESRDVENNTLLYLYYPEIPISFYNGNNGGMTITINYLDSAYQVITAETTTWRNSDNDRKLWDMTLTLTQEHFNKAFYIDLELGLYTLRYNVIKPIKATEYSQRICWRNSYGGISFFDFTGQKNETRELDVTTYEKNIFGYYDDPINELEKPYDNEVKYVVSVKSHLFENDGKYVFNDLLQSANVWTRINGQDYAIIIESINVEETDQNNIYEATVKYHYSQEPSLI